ncbi:hypothetical protein UFOVP707_27 [uncultured Caudovirales phage]|uniref:Uncharacterized protein n=1 Tax=uncultured Caudovirales phage TaxID=2100421 RepID=A0A6J5NHP9_9CAUD|nr:hypothetical protein UFOVP707_27 [uncultured Caudovirales phage]
MLRYVRAAGRSVTAREAAATLEVGLLAATYSLLRLSFAGSLRHAVSLEDTPARYKATVYEFWADGPVKASVPEWLQPRALPSYSAREVTGAIRRRERET